MWWTAKQSVCVCLLPCALCLPEQQQHYLKNEPAWRCSCLREPQWKKHVTSKCHRTFKQHLKRRHLPINPFKLLSITGELSECRGFACCRIDPPSEDRSASAGQSDRWTRRPCSSLDFKRCVVCFYLTLFMFSSGSSATGKQQLIPVK